MRSATLNITPEAARRLDRETSIELFRRICRVRSFELNVAEAVTAGRIKYPVYLGLGQEAIPAVLSMVVPRFMIFAQHRCHGTYLAFGGDPARLRDELLGLPSGTSGGRAGSNCIQCHETGVTMFGHHGFIGENVPLGVGAALGSGKPTLCLFGDGAAEEDYVFASLGFAASQKLPVLFVCEDNDLSILTPTSVRRRWDLASVAEPLGMPAVDLSDDPWTLLEQARQFKNALPALINVRTCRARWHVGAGTDGPPEWDRFALVKQRMGALQFGAEAARIEQEADAEMRKLWAQ